MSKIIDGVLHYTTTEFADLAGYDRQLIRSYRNFGLFNDIEGGGKGLRYYYPESDLERSFIIDELKDIGLGLAQIIKLFSFCDNNEARTRGNLIKYILTDGMD